MGRLVYGMRDKERTRPDMSSLQVKNHGIFATQRTHSLERTVAETYHNGRNTRPLHCDVKFSLPRLRYMTSLNQSGLDLSSLAKPRLDSGNVLSQLA